MHFGQVHHDRDHGFLAKALGRLAKHALVDKNRGRAISLTIARMHAAHIVVSGRGFAIQRCEGRLHPGFFQQREFGLVIAVGVGQAAQRGF